MNWVTSVFSLIASTLFHTLACVDISLSSVLLPVMGGVLGCTVHVIFWCKFFAPKTESIGTSTNYVI